VFWAEVELREADDIIGAGLRGIRKYDDLTAALTETTQRLGGVW
jgi:hypothetical protein